MEYQRAYAQAVERIEAALERYLPESGERYAQVVDAMRYGLLGGGKRIRAILTLEFCKACSGHEDDAMALACAVEMVHAYSLIHDDLPCMDNDELRRRKPSCWKQFGETTALLAGDGLLTKAFETAAQAPVAPPLLCRAVRELAASAGERGMLGGQVIDLASEGKVISGQELVEMYRMKTGALLCCAARLGCIAAGASEEKIGQAHNYAEKIGLAFQIVDDILDVTGSTQVLGKPVGSDASSKKNTYVTLYSIEQARRQVADLTAQAREILDGFSLQDEFLYRLTEQLAVREK